MQGGRVGATHIIEHFVELLGVHDKVGVAYHVVDRVCLDGRDTEDTERSTGLAALRLWAKGKGQVLPLRAAASLSGKIPLLPDFYSPFGSLLPLTEAFTGRHPLDYTKPFFLC